MTYASIVALLKTALLLLTLAQGPNVPVALKTQATTVANQAIAAATQALATAKTNTTGTSATAAPSSGGNGMQSTAASSAQPTPAPASAQTPTPVPFVMPQAPARISLTKYPNFNDLCYAFVTGYANSTNVIGKYAPTCTDAGKVAPLLFSVTQETNGGHAGAANSSSGRSVYMNDYDYDSDYGQWFKANFYPSPDGTVLGMALDTANYSKTNVTGWPLQQGNLFFGLNDISTDHADVHLDKDVYIEFDMRVRGDDVNTAMNPGTFSGHRIMLGMLLDWPEQGRANRAHYFEVNFAQTPGYVQIYHDPDLPLCHDTVYDRCAYDPGGIWSENRYVPYSAVSGQVSALAIDQWIHVKIPLSYVKSLHWVSAPASWNTAKLGGIYIALESTGSTRYWIEVKDYKVYHLQ